MDMRVFAFVGAIALVVALAIANFTFSNRERGLTASQYLLVFLIWGVMMVLYYIYERVY
jgi:hypothetical protein